MSAFGSDLPRQALVPNLLPRGDPPAVAVRLLGGFSLVVGARVIEEAAWRLQKAGHVVKLLALMPRHRLGQERLIDLLWGDLDPVAARNNFHRTLHAARRTLDADWGLHLLPLRHQTLALEAGGGLWVDVDAFEAAAATAQRGAATGAYHAALALYGGDLLPDDRYVDLFDERRETLRQRFLFLLTTVGRLHMARGEPAEAIEVFGRAIAQEPSCEEAHVELMRLYARLGQRHRALQQYALLRRALWRDLDVSPSPASQRLYADLLAGGDDRR